MKNKFKRSTSLKKMCDVASKTASIPFEWVTKSFVPKKNTIPNDALEEYYHRLECVQHLCEVFRSNLKGLKILFEAIKQQEYNAIAMADAIGSQTPLYCNKTFLSEIEHHSAGYIRASNEVDNSLEVLQELEITIDSKIKLALQAKEALDNRQRRYTIMLKKRKKNHSNKTSDESTLKGEPEKFDQALQAFNDSTAYCEELLNDFFKESSQFLEEIFHGLSAQRSHFVTVVKTNFNKAQVA